MDTDKDGVISVEEVRQAMEKRLKREVGARVSEIDARNLINAIDDDQSGDIDRDELLRYPYGRYRDPT
eukprot:3941150-Rhodomonas_salina.1